MTETITSDIRIQKVTQSRLPETDFSNLPFGRIFSDHMFVADFKNGKWTDARIVPYDQIKMTPANATLHYGQAIFEGLKAYKGDHNDILIFRPYENFKRMNASAERMCIPALPEHIFMGGINQLVSIDREWVPTGSNSSLYIRPFIFATDELIGVKPSDTYKFIIFTCPVGAYYNTPVRVKIEDRYSRACQGGTGAAKTAGNYAASLYPSKLAHDQGFHQLLWTDGQEHKYIEESGTMNVMFIIGDTLITAPASDTILHGITRKSVLELAREGGMKVEERKLSVHELIAAANNGSLKEAFGTGTAATIAHISEIGYEDQLYKLPAIENRVFSPKVYQTLEDLKHGRIKDTHQWMYKVN